MRTRPLQQLLSMLLAGVVLAHPVCAGAQAFASAFLRSSPTVNRPIPRPPHRVRYATAVCRCLRSSKAEVTATLRPHLALRRGSDRPQFWSVPPAPGCSIGLHTSASHLRC